MSVGQAALSLDAFLDAWVQAEEELKRGGRKLWPIFAPSHMHAPNPQNPYAFSWRKCLSQKTECFPRALWQEWWRTVEARR